MRCLLQCAVFIKRLEAKPVPLTHARPALPESHQDAGEVSLDPLSSTSMLLPCPGVLPCPMRIHHA